MPGPGSWRLFGFFVLSACGGRTTLDMPWVSDNGFSAVGGAPGSEHVPIASGGRSQDPGVGLTSGGKAGGSGSIATAGGGMAAAGAPAVPGVATMISAGADMSCATTSNGSVWCWGGNDHGQLGNGTKTNSWVPVRVSKINTAVAVSAGGTWNAGGKGASLSAFACAVLRNGAVVCWGDSYGAPALDRSVPRTIYGANEVVAIASGNAHTCALTRAGSVWCWGANDRGQLGTGVTDSGRADPSPVHGIVGAVAVAGQGSDFSCAVQADSSLWCWGKYNGGTDFSSLENAVSPVRISGVSTSASGLAAGRSNICAVSRESKELECWGVDYSSAAPITVRGLRAPAVAVSEGAFTTCALLIDHTIQCWGEGRGGQLGNDARSSSDVPVDVLGISDAVAVSVGYLHACALSKTGSVSCWGASEGLGNGSPSTRDALRPVPVTGFGPL